ncbi:MAG: hypothetical protein JSV66_11020 [Trueperaceae bacterium]|nr:MAG: hypothetical protein JSV66_11020 [Trueperaceae bacterium]
MKDIASEIMRRIGLWSKVPGVMALVTTLGVFFGMTVWAQDIAWVCQSGDQFSDGTDNIQVTVAIGSEGRSLPVVCDATMPALEGSDFEVELAIGIPPQSVLPAGTEISIRGQSLAPEEYQEFLGENGETVEGKEIRPLLFFAVEVNGSPFCYPNPPVELLSRFTDEDIERDPDAHIRISFDDPDKKELEDFVWWVPLQIRIEDPTAINGSAIVKERGEIDSGTYGFAFLNDLCGDGDDPSLGHN